MYANGTTKQATAFFQRHGKAIKSILDQAGDLDTAIYALEDFATEMNKSSLTWLPDTFAKHFLDYYGKAKIKSEERKNAQKNQHTAGVSAEPEF
jgi:predicted ATP-binding protein involved in virulence